MNRAVFPVTASRFVHAMPLFVTPRRLRSTLSRIWERNYDPGHRPPPDGKANAMLYRHPLTRVRLENFIFLQLARKTMHIRLAGPVHPSSVA
jgi:hypothetical protein